MIALISSSIFLENSKNSRLLVIFLLALSPEMAKTNPRLDKYLKKYHK